MDIKSSETSTMYSSPVYSRKQKGKESVTGVEMKSPVPPFVSVKISSTFLLSSQEGILAGHAVGTEGYFAAEKIAVGRHFPFVISQW